MELPAASGVTLLLTPEEAGALLGIGRTKVYQLMQCGDVVSVRIGSSRRIRRRDLEEYVKQLVD